MGTKRTRPLPARLASLQGRFEHWRRTRKISSRVPDALWSAAARAASTHGVSRVATMLRVNYNALKKRVAQGVARAGGRPSTRAAPPGDAVGPFVELASAASACECTLELENAGGAKMRVHLKGMAMPDLAALSRSFWNPRAPSGGWS
jgi:hypothetical protein